MTLEPVHIKAISSMVSRIDSLSEDDEPEKAPELFELLSELEYEGKVVLKALGKLFRAKVDIDRMSLAKDPFEKTYSCDSGSTNPISFNSGLYVDLCHCSIASTPTDIDLHSKWTMVMSTYSPGTGMVIDTTGGWDYFDENEGRASIVKIRPGLLKKRVDRMVHNIALYLSESEHILWLMEKFDEDGFFIMDGPIYPKQLMYWMVVESDEVQIRDDDNAKRILQNYVDIMDHHIANRRPLIGFVKNPEDMQTMITLRKKYSMGDLPWLRDSQFFKNVLSPGKDEGKGSRWITYTNWFLQPNQFYENMMDSTSLVLDLDLKHEFPKEDYAITFFMVFVPSIDVLFKIESPYGITKDEQMRDQITRKVLHDIAVNGIPMTLSKADSLAKIRISEKKLIKGMFKGQKIDTIYNDVRWGESIDDQ
ncbi:DNA double-strand break repair nuclease NurA [Methanococcoides orientis]|uniref:DNA double-strand break repair nuclease NurA n=1 Tax=Methanococcoides orientis TaxID=2822137 RepID=UPI001E342F96|nr:DNA double-strand break repair nuclease NurA [Methanococcoides orientis]UGV40710.1 DNA double-strand break repair nuclease NurA [Methanococcoides orientis]